MQRSGLILLGIMLVMGCDSSHSLQKNLDKYQTRMANVLGVDSQEHIKVSLPPYPSIKSLNQNIPATRIKLFEFYDLKHCALHSLVAERNTSLGNLQLPSTRYIYERHLIDALSICSKSTTNTKLQEKLVTWKQTKTTQLPMVWANLIQLSNEIKQGLSANYALVEGNEQDDLTHIKEVLNYLLKINLDPQVNGAKLEQNLQRLFHNPLPAKLWLSQATLTEFLYRSTEWLVKHTTELQCTNNQAKEKIEYLTNVFQQFFIEKIQPIASQINHYQYQLSPIFEDMATHPDLSPSFKQYIKQFNQHGFDDYNAAMQQHIQFWQALFKRCNIQPGKR